MIEDVPHLIPVGDIEVTPGGFNKVRDGDGKSDMELESITSRVMEQALDGEGESSEGMDVEQFMYPVGPIYFCPHFRVQASAVAAQFLQMLGL